MGGHDASECVEVEGYILLQVRPGDRHKLWALITHNLSTP